MKRFSMMLAALALALLTALLPIAGDGVLPCNTAYAATNSGYVTLQKGSTGDAVVRVQQRLIELGYLQGYPDGDYGNNTVSAVAAFQSANGLVADGIAGPATQALLFGEQALRYTGAAAKGSGKSGAAKSSSGSTGNYIGNKNTKKFHKPGCGSVKQMKDSNKVALGSRDEAISGGYVPCQRCNP